MRLKFIFLVALLLAPSTVFAGNVTVYDAAGLIRAQRPAPGPVSLEVVLECIKKGPEKITVTLSNTDGLQNDITGFSFGDCRYRLEGVAEGAWKIEVTPERVVTKVAFLSVGGHGREAESTTE